MRPVQARQELAQGSSPARSARARDPRIGKNFACKHCGSTFTCVPLTKPCMPCMHESARPAGTSILLPSCARIYPVSLGLSRRGNCRCSADLACVMCGEDLPDLPAGRMGKSRSARELYPAHAAHAVRSPLGGPNPRRIGISGSSVSASSTITSCSLSQAPDLAARFVTEHGAAQGAAGRILGDVSDTPEELEEFTYVNTRVEKGAVESTARWLNLPIDLPHHAPRVWL